MITQETVLVQLLRSVERIPTPPRSGRPTVYPDGLFLKALVIMIVRRIHRVGELLAVLEEPPPRSAPCASSSPRTVASLRAQASGPAPDPSREVRGCWGATWWRC
jgi:hypothetical protein